MEYFMTTTSTISQVLVAVVVGAVGSSSVPFSKKTFRDFSYLVSNGGFGCLLFSHMATSLSADVLRRSSVLLVFASLGIFIGYISATIFGVAFFQPSQVDRGAPHPDAEVFVEFPNGPQGAARVVIQYAVDDSKPHANLSDQELLSILRAPLCRYEECVGYQTLAKTSCCLQNATVLPLSLISRLGASPALSWFSVEDATTYIFVYNVVVSTVFWSWGLQATIGGAVQFRELRAIRHAAERFVHLSSRRRSVAVSTPLLGNDDGVGYSRPYFEDYQNVKDDEGRDAQGDLSSSPSSPPVVVRRVVKTYPEQQLSICQSLHLFATSSIHRQAIGRAAVRVGKEAVGIAIQSLQSPPFAGTVFGMLIGVTPPLHRAIELEPLASAFSAIALAGGCAVPGSLLLLGASLAGNSISFDMEHVRLRHASQQTTPYECGGVEGEDCQLSGSFSWSPADPSWKEVEAEEAASDQLGNKLRRRRAEAGWRGSADQILGHLRSAWRYMTFLMNLDGVSRPFVFGIAVVRLIVIPVICFAIAAALTASGTVGAIADPHHNTMLVVMLILCAAPTSITIVMMSNVHQFMVRPVAKMLFYQYFFTIPSSMLWLTVALWMTS